MIFCYLLFIFILSKSIECNFNFQGQNSKVSFPSPSSLFKANATCSGISGSLAFPNPNVQLSNSSSSATFGGISSTTITFGSLNKVILTADATISPSDQSWHFPSSATFDGQGHSLTINKNQAIQVSSNATLTIKNCTIICAGRDPIGCISDAAKVVFDSCTIVLGSEGLGWKQGSIDIQNQVQVVGYSKSFCADPSGAELLLRATEIGFGLISGNADRSLYTLDFCGPTDERSGISIARVDKTGSAFLSDSPTPYTPSWNSIPGGSVYKCISIGVDGTVWLVGINNTVYRYRNHKDANIGVTATYGIFGTIWQITVANRYYVFVLNSSGEVYKCNDPDRGFLDNPLTGAPSSWTKVSNVNAKSIAAGTDGCLWYINQTGQVFCRDSSGNETLIHDGAGCSFIKVSAKGTATRNCIALTCSSTNRAFISYDGCPFKDLGLSNVQEAATEVNGNLLVIFQSSKVSEDQALGAPLYHRHSFGELPVLALDKTLNFCASAGANLTIKSGASLAMGPETTLRMNADSAFAETNYSSRRHLVFADASSTLVLDRANLEAVGGGLALTKGNVIVNGICALKPCAWQNSQIEISSDVNLNIRSGGNLQAYGRVDYCAPSRLMTEVETANGIQTTFTYPKGHKDLRFDNTSNGHSIRKAGYRAITTTAINQAFIWPEYVLGRPLFGNVPESFISVGSANMPTNGIVNGSIYIASDNLGRNNPVACSLDQITGSCTITNSSFISPYSGVGADGTLVVSVDSGSGVNNLRLEPSKIIRTNVGSDPINNTLYVADINNIYFQSGGNFEKYSGSGTAWNPVKFGSYSGVRDIVPGTDGSIWFLNNKGDFFLKRSDGKIVGVKGTRGKDFIKIRGTGSESNCKIMLLTRNCDYYGYDNARGLTLEFECNPPYNIANAQKFGIDIYGQTYCIGAGTGLMCGWKKGYRPSNRMLRTDSIGPRGGANFLGYEYAIAKTLEASCLRKGWKSSSLNGFGSLGKITSLRYNPSKTTNQIFSYSITSLGSYIPKVYYDKYGNKTSTDSTSMINPVGALGGNAYENVFSMAEDGTELFVQATTLTGNARLQVLSGGAFIKFPGAESFSSITSSPSRFNTPLQVSAGSLSNIWAIMSTYEVRKWSSGTTWNVINLYPTNGVRWICATTDGGLFFIDEVGDLKFRSSEGVISYVSGGQGKDLIKVDCQGTSNGYKLVAVDFYGNLYSCDENRALESENITDVAMATVAKNGLCYVCGGSKDGENERICWGWIIGSSSPK